MRTLQFHYTSLLKRALGLTITFLALQMLTGCIGPLVPVVRIDQNSQNRLANQVRVFRIAEAVDGHVTRIAPISATSCKNQLTDPSPSEEDAFAQLRYRATQSGGNSVLDATCDSEGTNLSKNCWSSITCRGTAAMVDPDVQGKDDKPSKPAMEKLENSGSGFFINRNGVLVTNQHVVEGCKVFHVRSAGVESSATLLAVDESNDLAVLQAETVAKVPFLSLRSSPAKLAEPVAALGFPLPGVLSPSVGASTGTVSSLSGIKGDSRFIQINAPLQPGNSGGPLIDERGLVVGVVVSKLNTLLVARATGDIPQNVNFAIGLRSLQTFLEARSVVYVVADSASRNLSASSEKASIATVQVLCSGEK